MVKPLHTHTEFWLSRRKQWGSPPNWSEKIASRSLILPRLVLLQHPLLLGVGVCMVSPCGPGVGCCGWMGWLEIEGKVFCEGWNLIQKYLLHWFSLIHETSERWSFFCQTSCREATWKTWKHERNKLHFKCFTVFVSCTASEGPRGVSGGSELTAAMAEPTKQERYTKLMEALEAFAELELDIGCFGDAQVEEEISNYCRTFAIAEADLKDEEIECKEDFALFVAHNCFWQNLRSPDFRLTDQTHESLRTLESLRTVVDHLKVLLQPPVDWQQSKTLSALVGTFLQMSKQSDILNFYAGCRKVWVRCGDVIRKRRDFFSQAGKRLARKMREDVIQVAKMALRTQQFKTIVNDDLSAAVKDFLNKIRIWCQNAGEADCEADLVTEVQCLGCQGGWACQNGPKILMLCNLEQTRVRPTMYGDRIYRVARGFSEFTTNSQKLRDATSKLLDLSVALELQNSDAQPDVSATSLSSWSLIDVADQTLEVASIASYNSVDSQTSCLSASGGPHCFLPTCRFKCVEDETSLVREVLGKDAKSLKRMSFLTKIIQNSFVIMKLDSRWCYMNSSSLPWHCVTVGPTKTSPPNSMSFSCNRTYRWDQK